VITRRPRNQRRAANGSFAPDATPPVDETPVALTTGQAVALLALSRGEQYPLPPIQRRFLLRERLVRPIGERTQRGYVVTPRGIASLAASPRLAGAQRLLDQIRERV
jgi:hypothetical protein